VQLDSARLDKFFPERLPKRIKIEEAEARKEKLEFA
jgi:hypothetical protein